MHFTCSSDIPRYRYFFNGQEADNEVYGEGAVLGYEFRQYDARIGRFWSVDPLAGKFPWNSTYAFAENSPVGFIELEGLERYWSPQGSHIGNVGNSTEIRIINNDMDASVAKKHVASANGSLPQIANEHNSILIQNSISFKDYAQDIPDVLNNAKLVQYSGNCKDAAEKQMNEVGVYQSGPKNAIQINAPSSLQTNPIGAMIYTMTQLKEGKPVMFGVMNANEQHRKDVGNYNSKTSHFIVVSGMIKSYKGGTPAFYYYDNASSQYGKSKNNILVTDPDRERIKGSRYEATETRKNIE